MNLVGYRCISPLFGSRAAVAALLRGTGGLAKFLDENGDIIDLLTMLNIYIKIAYLLLRHYNMPGSSF